MSKVLAKQSLQKKVSRTLLAVMAALVVLSFVTLDTVIGPAFDQLELDQARTNIIRAERAIQNDLDNLSAIAGDWAIWDDAYNYVRGDYPAFAYSNLDQPTLTNLELSLLLIYDANANLLWGQVVHEDELVDPSTLGVFDPGTATAFQLIRHTDVQASTDGLLRTDLGPMLLSSWPVVTSDGVGPIAGTMIMGQFLDQAKTAQLRSRTEVDLDWQLIDQESYSKSPPLQAFSGDTSGFIHYETTDDAVTSYRMLVDLFGEPLMLLQVRTPREISALGERALNGALLFLALAGIVVAAVTWLSLRSTIVLPLEALAAHITAVRESGDLSKRLKISRTDEIGSLGRQFDKLTGEVHDARMRLLDQSFKAGKADAAAEVLHNIRNAMTPLINGLDRVAKNWRAASRLRVNQATEELGDPTCPDHRREKLLMYIDSAFAHVRAMQDDAIEDLSVAAKQAHQVESILSDQEKHANVAPIIEDFELGNIIDEAILVIPKSDDPEVEVNLRRKLHQFRVRGHRVGVLQVLGNLMLNAYESIQRSDSQNGKIAVSAAPETVEDKQMIRLTVTDTGCGFDDKTRQKIFQRGFSSKEGHLSGLGLHWCANALASMGGHIQADSRGLGQGAQFHVLLPAAQGG